MNYDLPPKIEQIGKNRERLLALEKEGKYVFHGSLDELDNLEPRQAYNRNEETGEMEKDGEPAVFATQYADIAIFRSLVNAKNTPEESRSSFGIDNKRLHFSATKNLIDSARKIKGNVYVLDRSNFQNFESMQCRSYNKVVPTEVIEVTVDDLPGNIQEISENK